MASARDTSTRRRTRLAAGLILGLGLASALPVSRAAAQVPADADSAVVIDTAAAWEEVAAARDAAAADRHHAAVAAYLDALGHDAGLVRVVAKEIAYQKLWREDAAKAIFYFRRYLARHPDEDNRSVKAGLALAHSWYGEQGRAIALYRELVAEDPTDGAARTGLGRSLVWNNNLREGGAVLLAVEADDTSAGGAGAEATNFLLTVLDEYTPHLDLRVAGTWDSDDLDIYRVTGTASVEVLGNTLLQIIPLWATYRQPGQARISAPRLGAGLIAPLARNWTVHAYAWLDRFRSAAPLFGRPDELDWTRPGGDLWFTWLPASRLRLDFGGGSQPLETFVALDQHNGFHQANLSADWRLHRSWTLGAGGLLADYRDGNTKRQGYARLTWRREGRLEILFGPSLTYLDFERNYPGGYWSPDWVRNTSLELTLKTRTRALTFRLAGRVGLEREIGAEEITVGGGSGRIGWRVSRRGLIALEAGYSRSRFTSASGYRRTFASLSWRMLF